jgi:GT2 family glycosyltransferase
VSVIIPTRNNPEKLSLCLQALTADMCGRADAEIIVLDNSDPASSARSSQVAASWPGLVRWLHTEPKGLMEARHDGARAARGEYLAFLDDDVLVERGWLAAVCEGLALPEVGLVTGRLDPLFEADPPAWIEGLWRQTEAGRYLGYLSLCDFGPEMKEVAASWVIGANMATSRALFFELGGTNPDYMPVGQVCLQGDGEIGYAVRVEAAGKRILYAPKARASHIVGAQRMTPDYLCARAYFVGLHMEYTDTRRQHGLGPRDGVPFVAQPARGLRGLAGLVSRGLRSMGEHLRPARSESEQVDRLLRRSQARGRRAMRNSLKVEPSSLEWVLRRRYLELPAGLTVQAPASLDPSRST